MVDQLEARIRDGEEAYLWDAQGWYGGDINKFWFKTEGEGNFGESPEQVEVQALWRSEEHTSELQSLMRNSYAVFCLKKKTNNHTRQHGTYDNIPTVPTS